MAESVVMRRLAEHVRLRRLPGGGHVLVDLSTMDCHELADAAADLLAAGRPAATDEEREFVAHCVAMSWLRTDPDRADAGRPS